MPSVEEINDIRDLAGYRLLWNSLLPQTGNATFFHSLDWLGVYWKHYGGNQKLRTLIVSAADRPIGIVPLVIRREQTRVGPVRTLTFPLHNWGTFYGPLGPNPTATLLAGLNHVRQTRRDWDLFDLRWVDKVGYDFGRTQRVMEFAGTQYNLGLGFTSPTGEWTVRPEVGWLVFSGASSDLAYFQYGIGIEHNFVTENGGTE